MGMLPFPTSALLDSPDREDLSVPVSTPLSLSAPLPSSSAAFPFDLVKSFSCFCTDSESFSSAQAEIHSFIIERTRSSFLDFVILIPLGN